MMDKFFTQKHCDRCRGSLKVRTMSMMNTDCICLSCADKETKHPDYWEIRKKEQAEVRKGNYNYEGGL